MSYQGNRQGGPGAPQRGGYGGGGGDRGRGRGRGADSYDLASRPRGGGRGGGRGGRGRGGAYAPGIYTPRLPGYVAVPNQSVTKLEKSVEASIRDLGKKNMEMIEFPYRPAFGTDGRTIKLFTNHMEVAVKNDVILHRYAIDINEVKPRKASQDPKQSKEARPGDSVKQEEGPKGKKAKRIIQLMIKDNPDFDKIAVATDFRSFVITNQDLNFDSTGKTYDVAYFKEDEDGPSNDPKMFRVKVAPTQPVYKFQVSDLLAFLASGSVRTTPQVFQSKEEVLQCLNIVVGYHPKSRDNVTSVRTGATGAFKYYSNQVSSATPHSLGSGLEAIRGFFLSVRPATSRLLVNVQVKNAAFYLARPLTQVIVEHYDTHGRNAYRLANFLKKVSVNVTHIKKKNKRGQEVMRIKMIFDLASRSDGSKLEHPPLVEAHGAGPDGVKFWFAPPESTKPTAGKAVKSSAAPGYITVTQFFKQAYNMVLRRPDLPVVNVGSRASPVYLPAEVCEIRPGQPCNTKLSPAQTASMIGFAVRPPYLNAQTITDTTNSGGVGLLGFNGQGGNDTLRNFGVRVQPELLAVLGRILSSPQIKYSQKLMVPRFASWNLQDVSFLSHTVAKSWTWIVFNSSRRPINTTDPAFLAAERSFVQTLRASGVQCGEPTRGLAVPVSSISDITKTLVRLNNATKTFAFVLIVLPDKNTEMYNEVKWQCDTQIGIHCLCVTANNFMKANPQLNANLALKINLKLGGSNHATDLGLINEGKTMVVGIDVTHPSPGSADTAPSIAAMVASVDGRMTQFPAAMSVQNEARKEMVDNIGNLFKSRLKLWQSKNKTLPENILVYRDGVSEGQYELVLRNELDNMRSVSKCLYGETIPKFTFIVVGKRHHTRFYPQSTDGADRSSNPPNGVIVDSQITEARNWDFFLQAHTALQGTARPAHYYVIHDEIFRARYAMQAAGRLEALTHNMCYMFGRATKAVSIAPPAYYADLVCNRARCYLTNYYDPQSDFGTPAGSLRSGNTTGTPTSAGTADRASQADRITLHPKVADSMFYI